MPIDSSKLPRFRPVRTDYRAQGVNPAPIEYPHYGFVPDDKMPGRRVEVTAPGLPFENWIDAEGNVVSVPYRTTRVMEGGRSVDQSAHKQQQEALHYSAGWLKYDSGLPGEDPASWVARRDAEIERRRVVAKQNSMSEDFMSKLSTDEKVRTQTAESFANFIEQIMNRRASKAVK